MDPSFPAEIRDEGGRLRDEPPEPASTPRHQLKGEELFLAWRPLLERVLASVCRRKCLSDDDAEELRSRVMEHLIDDEYAKLRQFEGRSSMKGYLFAVVSNQLKDYWNEKWGRWRVSEIARRLGPVAEQLETLLVRDGFSFDEAARILRTHHRVSLPVADLAELAAQLPPRTLRRIEGEEVLESVASSHRAEERVEDAERSEIATRAEAVLRRMLEALDPEERLILRTWTERFSLARVAKVLGVEQKPLYRRRERLQMRLRAALEEAGLSREEIRRLFGGRSWRCRSAPGK